MTTTPTKYKDPNDYTVDEYVEFRKTGKRPVTKEWREYRREIMDLYDLESDDVNTDHIADKPLEDLTPDEHLVRRTNR